VTLPQESEKQFQAAIVDLAQQLGWHCFHTFDSRRSASGFPDLFMVRGRRAIAAELKSDTGRVTEAQDVWLAALAEAGVETFVWRPRDKQTITGILIGRPASVAL